MPYSSWDQDPDRLRASARNIAQIEAQIRALPPDQRSYYQLQQRGITIPPGYRLEKDGRLKYVAVDNSKHWYNEAKYMIPAIASAGMLSPYVMGGAGAAGVGAAGLGSGLNAATAGAAAHAGSPLLMGSGALLGAGAGAATLGSAALTSGLGYGPASLAGTSSAEALLAGIPEIASRQIGNGMGSTPSLAGTTAAGVGSAGIGGALSSAGNGIGSTLGNVAKNALTGDGGVPDWLKAVMGSLAGLPALLAAKQGPSDEEKAYADQARRLLAQQEQRTQYQNPLYEYITKSVYGLQPGTGGAPYAINALSDVKIPGMEK